MRILEVQCIPVYTSDEDGKECKARGEDVEFESGRPGPDSISTTFLHADGKVDSQADADELGRYLDRDTRNDDAVSDIYQLPRLCGRDTTTCSLCDNGNSIGNDEDPGVEFRL